MPNVAEQFKARFSNDLLQFPLQMENGGIFKNLVGAGEAGLALGSGYFSGITSGWKGLGAALGAVAPVIMGQKQALGTVPGYNPVSPDVWLPPAVQAIEQDGTPVYQPRTPAGQEALSAVRVPFELWQDIADRAGWETTKATDSKALGASLYSIMMGARPKPTSKKPSTSTELSTLKWEPAGKPVIDIPKKDVRVVSAAEVGDRVSTRFPTAVKRTENPLETHLTIGLNEAMVDMKAFSHNVDLFRAYDGIKPLRPRSAVGKANHIIDHMKDNLLWLYDQVPETTRNRSKQWYVGANNISNNIATQHNVLPRSVGGVIANLSPKRDWYGNAELGGRVVNMWSEMQSPGKYPDKVTEEVYQTALRVFVGKTSTHKKLLGTALDLYKRGIPYAEMERLEKGFFIRLLDQTYNQQVIHRLNPEGEVLGLQTNKDGTTTRLAWAPASQIAKGIDILDSNGDISVISQSLGEAHKIRNFYNNMIDPYSQMGDVTIDTHATGAALLRPLSMTSEEVLHLFGGGVTGRGRNTKSSSITGVQGSYPIYAESYRQAANERGVLPREMQSITWEAIRGLFPDSLKNPKNNAIIDTIWRSYDSGKLTASEARGQVLELAGGINAPDWETTP